jgi:hypothetical protein
MMIDLETRNIVEVKTDGIAGPYIPINTWQAQRIVGIFRQCNIVYSVSWALTPYQDTVINIEPGSSHQIQHLIDQLDNASPVPPTYFY